MIELKSSSLERVQKDTTTSVQNNAHQIKEKNDNKKESEHCYYPK
uniref:Uncharacterized protein n=1 Tax=Ascaris lumbricoides TaxID=6252 RepID=A0A0M3IQQ2_ASCLU